MKKTLVLALTGVLLAAAVPAFAQGGLVLPSAPGNAREQRLNDLIEMQVQSNRARGITNSRDIQRAQRWEDRRDRRERRWEREDRRRWEREERRRDRRQDRW